ncbi:MAG TPA: hypothetical protein VFC26_03545, partial [Verrucomicrobiae bacterium]|nr:hypothetical protein [Verrucomicrobiae bacterium]
QQCGFRTGLPGLTANAADQYAHVRRVSGFHGCELQDWLEQTGVTNTELRCVDSHRKAAVASLQVVADQSALSRFVDFTPGIER